MTTKTSSAIALTSVPLATDTQIARAGRMRWIGPASAYAPLLGLGFGAYLALGGKQRALAKYTLAGTLGLALARWQFARFFTERAEYDVERRIGDIEVRHYAATVRAETVVSGATWSEALSEGFQRVAGYIFGSNRDGGKVQMTAPVLASVGDAERADRTVSFIMPGNSSLTDLPTPNDPRVRVQQAPAQRLAALRFRGRYGGALPASKRAELLRQLDAAGLTPVGEVLFAGYDAPSTLPWWRRNEVLVEVQG